MVIISELLKIHVNVDNFDDSGRMPDLDVVC